MEPIKQYQRKEGNVANSPYKEGGYRDLQWLKLVIDLRIDAYFNDKHFEFASIYPPTLDLDCHYSQFIHTHTLEPAERLCLALAFSSEFFPTMLDIFFSKNNTTDQIYTEFGGVELNGARGFVPTIQTALFLLAGDHLEQQLDYLARLCKSYIKFFSTRDFDFCSKFIRLAPLRLHRDVKSRLLGQDLSIVDFNELPIREIVVNQNWGDLILSNSTLEQLVELDLWVKHSDELIQNWYKNNPYCRGYKALFHGPPGTGKTMTAGLLGKKTGRRVLKVDISQLISKYIGETSKNLDKVFEAVEDRNHIIFFDEADSLFSARTNVSNSNDRHANQEIGHLLQKIEDFNGIVILATNIKENIDEAFMRRFHSVVHFTRPGEEERLKLWSNAFSDKASTQDVDFRKIANTYDLSGAEIANVVRFCSLQAIENKTFKIFESDVEVAIRGEMLKVGRYL